MHTIYDQCPRKNPELASVDCLYLGRANKHLRWKKVYEAISSLSRADITSRWLFGRANKVTPALGQSLQGYFQFEPGRHNIEKLENF